MKFSVSTNWQNDLIPTIKNDSIEQLYGKLAVDFMGGLRPSYSTPHISKEEAAVHIQEAHKNGLTFNYLLNSTCLNGLEWTRAGQKQLHSLLDWLVDIKVDSVTVSIPYLLELIKKQYPQLKVYVSSFAGINTAQKAKYWEDLGADALTLPNSEVNRDFPLLKAIRKSVKCSLQLVANIDCLYKCPFQLYHGNLNSHSSQLNRSFFIDYCVISCRYRLMANPTELICSPWIRPEDVSYYEEVGIDRLKLIDRSMTTKALSVVAEAYVKRRYDGNLLDLFPSPSKSMMFQKANLFQKFKFFFRPFLINVFKLIKAAESVFNNVEVHIDNRKLDGFLEHFVKEACYLKSCEECGYCKHISEQAVRAVSTHQQEVLAKRRRVLDELISGGIFTYMKC